MKKHKEIAGYALGGLMFVLLIPTLMWWASGTPDLLAAPMVRMVIAIVLAVLGLSLSVWSIIYMRRKGDGNPMDAFGHEVAPRTKHLMTEGPYRLSRNPMLTGSFVYYAGVCVGLWTWHLIHDQLCCSGLYVVKISQHSVHCLRTSELFCNLFAKFPWKSQLLYCRYQFITLS